MLIPMRHLEKKIKNGGELNLHIAVKAPQIFLHKQSNPAV